MHIKEYGHGGDPAARIAELNLLFLALLSGVAAEAEDRHEAVLGLSREQLDLLATLDGALRQRLAGAPVALFRMPLQAPRAHDGLDPLPWLPSGRTSMQQAFSLTVLACQWHMVRTNPDWVTLGFGLGPAELATLQHTPLSRLPGLATAASAGLAARFTGDCGFWPRVLGLASGRRFGDLALANVAALHMASAERVSAAAPLPGRVADAAMALQCDD